MEDKTLFVHIRHPHQPKNVNAAHNDGLTFGQRIADRIATGMGSWPYIIIQSIIVVLWIVLNLAGWFLWKWDVPPFILLNLIFSTQASYAAPIIMMSQNRQAEKDRLMAEETYTASVKDEAETRAVIEHLSAQDAELLKQTELLVQVLQAKQTGRKTS